MTINQAFFHVFPVMVGQLIGLRDLSLKFFHLGIDRAVGFQDSVTGLNMDHVSRIRNMMEYHLRLFRLFVNSFFGMYMDV